MKYNWNPEKNEILKKGLRGVSFEEISEAMENGKIIRDFRHPNQEKYPNQFIAWVFFRDYVWQVPYVVQPDGTRFLKTAFPSRVATKKKWRCMMLSFEEHVKKYELDEYEQEILAASEAGLLKEDEHSAERIAALQQAAHETMEEIRAKRAANATKSITLRVPVRVIERYKRRAAASGVKYQTLMNEILDAAPV